MEGLSTLVEYILRSTAVCLIATLVLLFLRKSAAAYRHLVCVLSLATLLTLPLLRDLLPPIPLPEGLVHELPVPALAIPPPAELIAPIAIPPPAPPVILEPPAVVPPAPLAPPIPVPPATPLSVLLFLWLTGVVLLLVRLTLALVRLAVLKAASLPASTEQSEWLAALARVQRISTRIEFRIGPADTAPVTWGVRRPVILLPESLTTDDGAGESAARHELAHIDRRDWLWQMLAEVVCALYWFQPGVWWLRHRLRAESERACDDAVLLSGVTATDYASHLLLIARRCRRPGTLWVAPLAMARPLGLEVRLRSILNNQLPRHSTPSRRLGIVALALPLLGATALQGVASPKSSGSIPPPAPPALVPPPSLPSPLSPASPIPAVPPVSRVLPASPVLPVPPAPPVPAPPNTSWTDSLKNFLTSSVARFPNLPRAPQTTPEERNDATSLQAEIKKDVAPMSKDTSAIAWGKAQAQAPHPTAPAPIQAIALTPARGTAFPLQSDAVRWNGYDYHLVSLVKPSFHMDSKSQHLIATCQAGVTTFDDVTYTITAEIQDTSGKTLVQTKTKVPVSRIWLGGVLTTSKKVQFDFGPFPNGATQYVMNISHERVLTPDQWQKDPHEQAKAYLEKIREARKENDDKALWGLFIDRKFDEAVQTAAERGDEALAAELIQQSWFGGPRSGGNGVTWAAYYPSEKPVATLLKQGVRADVANADGDTGLHLTYRVEIARLLLDRGAKLEARNTSGQTPLIAQAFRANQWTGRGILSLLLERGAEVNAVGNDGMTALMYAAKQGMVDDVKALLQHGADRQREDNKGKTARDYVSPWHWQSSPGFMTQERARELEAQANWDRYRIAALLEGKPDPGDRSKNSGESLVVPKLEN